MTTSIYKAMTTEQGNKLIAEFMGLSPMEWKVIASDEMMKIWVDKSGLTVYDKPDLNYRSSWAWLMPVVEKIEKEMFATVEIVTGGCIIKCNDDKATKFARFGKPKLEMTWLCIIEYVKWNKEFFPHDKINL